MKPNLFSVATKELSQDAFITWSIQWADERNRTHNEELQKYGNAFVSWLVRKQLPKYGKVSKIQAGRQWPVRSEEKVKLVDIWALVNDNIFMIIEDKKDAKEHGNQLLQYQEYATAWCKENNYQLICIYFKTGSESSSSLQKITDKGYIVVDRNDLLGFMGQFKNIDNDIIRDFWESISLVEEREQAYQTTPIKDWDTACWTGFYRRLETERNIVNWDKVNNASGGFLNALINWKQTAECVFPLYMQIEQGKLVFKVSVHPLDTGIENVDATMIRNSFSAEFIEYAVTKGYPEVNRPGRFGKGKTMAIAAVNREIWLGSDEAFVDFESSLIKINAYDQLLENFIESSPKTLTMV